MSVTIRPCVESHGTNVLSGPCCSGGWPRWASARSSDPRSRGRSAHSSTTSPRIALTCARRPKRSKRAAKVRALRSANSACSHGRSDAAIRCTVPRTVHVRKSGAARSALRVRPGTRERSASAAARRSCAWTPMTARAASSALEHALAGVRRCAARRTQRKRWSLSTTECAHDATISGVQPTSSAPPLTTGRASPLTTGFARNVHAADAALGAGGADRARPLSPGSQSRCWVRGRLTRP